MLTVPGSKSNTLRHRSATVSIRRTGSRTNIRRCRRKSRAGRAAGVPRVRAVPSADRRRPSGVRQHRRASGPAISSARWRSTRRQPRRRARHHHDRDRQGDDRRGNPHVERILRQPQAALATEGGRRARPRRRASSAAAACAMRTRRAAPSRSAAASSSFRIPPRARSGAIRSRISSPMCRRAASPTARRSPRAATARPSPAASATGRRYKGLGDVPGLAGRDPTYTFRQLYDMQQGRRKGDAMALMKVVVEKLIIDDMIALSAYTASLEPYA